MRAPLVEYVSKYRFGCRASKENFILLLQLRDRIHEGKSD